MPEGGVDGVPGSPEGGVGGVPGSGVGGAVEGSESSEPEVVVEDEAMQKFAITTSRVAEPLEQPGRAWC